MNKVAVILGSGRSGTSLVMNILYRLGVNIPGELTKASEQNPRGSFEDKMILDTQLKLLSDLNTNQFLPMPERWENGDIALGAIDTLAGIVKNRMEESPILWGFKDPRTALLLPLWIRVFNQCKVVPEYFLAVRHPGSVVTSLYTQYGTPKELGEIFWLLKITEAILHTSGRVFIVHYEDILSSPVETALSMSNHLDLGWDQDKGKLQSLMEEVVTPNFNRAGLSPHGIVNPDVMRLYHLLQKYKGTGFDRDEVFRVARECSQRLMVYKGWALEAQFQIAKMRRMGISNARKMAKERDRMAKEHVRLSKEKEILNLQIRNLRNSLPYKLAIAAAQSIKKPSMGALLLPFDMVKICYRHTMVKLRKN